MTEESRPRPFHERFDIEVNTDEARRRFVSRANSLIFGDFWKRHLQSRSHTPNSTTAVKNIAYRLGDAFSTFDPVRYFRGDFRRCLQAIEATYEVLVNDDLAVRLSRIVDRIIRDSEIDLGLSWQPPVFVRTGAPLLDEHLVNEPLRWLSDSRYKTVYDPFLKGLTHYLEATNRPERLGDVVTDMYEATEALARIVTGKDSELSGNRELFIKHLKVSGHYKDMLRNYIAYGNEYRHAARQGNPRPPLSEPEVESFIYLTGLFIRLAIRTT